jgi:MFS family permease
MGNQGLKHIHYSWVMTAISASVLATHTLTTYTFGIFLTPLTTEFDWERGALSGAFAISNLLAGVLSIPAGRLTDKYGPRLLITVYGVLTAIAFLLMTQINSLWQVYLIWALLLSVASGCVLIPVFSTIPRWFTQRRGMAMGITVTGLGLGGIISPLLAQWLISAYGWRQSYFIIGLIILVMVTPLAQFMKHSPQRAGLKPYGETRGVEDKQSLASATDELSLTQAIKTSRFWVLGLIQFSFFFCMQSIFVHIVPHARDIGIPEVIAASMISIIAGVSIIGRNFVGFISDRIGGMSAQGACLFLMTLALIWLLFARDAWMFSLFAVFFGIAYGGMVALLTIVAAELFRLQSLGIILGSLLLLGTLGQAVGAPLTGSIFDITESYRLAFLICIVISAAAVILSLVLLRYKGKTGVTKE